MFEANNKIRVLVLGDMGCSPRMRNHCLSFANSSWEVYFSGYLKSDLPLNLTSNKNITVDPIKRPSSFFEDRKKNKIFLIIKVLLSAFYLLQHLLYCQWTPILLIQNPPAVPTFIVAWIISNIRGTKIIIDWHNYGHTLMNAETNQQGSLAKLYKHIELKFSRRLKAHNFCVSKAFKNDLLLKWNIPSTVLYDRPLTVNDDRNLMLYHKLFVKLSKEYKQFGKFDDELKSLFTEILPNGECQYRENRPAIIASSCSWTIDDDFETLFKALGLYNEEILFGELLPDIVCVITGRGPMKSYFERLVSEQEWAHVTVVMPWLTNEDYPVMLAAADLGICLHKSTSGLDLPMKIVDMFSVCLPVLALNYRCLHELVTDRVNGRMFSSTEGLLKQLTDLLRSFHDPESRNRDLDDYRHNIATDLKQGLWQDHWESVVLPVALTLATESRARDKAQ